MTVKSGKLKAESGSILEEFEDPAAANVSEDRYYQYEYLQEFPSSAVPVHDSAVPEHCMRHAQESENRPPPGLENALEPAGEDPKAECQ